VHPTPPSDATFPVRDESARVETVPGGERRPAHTVGHKYVNTLVGVSPSRRLGDRQTKYRVSTCLCPTVSAVDLAQSREFVGREGETRRGDVGFEVPDTGGAGGRVRPRDCRRCSGSGRSRRRRSPSPSLTGRRRRSRGRRGGPGRRLSSRRTRGRSPCHFDGSRSPYGSVLVAPSRSTCRSHVSQ
jgi:hypothetical protein